jgi:hypothetical protein
MWQILRVFLGFFVACRGGIAAPAAPAPIAAPDVPEAVICKEKSAPISYRLQFAWSAEMATIEGRSGTGAWQLLFRKAGAVRSGDSGREILVESTPDDWAGPSGNKCGKLLETLFFDLEPKGAYYVGSVEKTREWVAAAGAEDAGCPSPDLIKNHETTAALICN